METMVLPPRTGMEAFKLMPEGTYCQLINDKLIMSPAPFMNHAKVQAEIFSVIDEIEIVFDDAEILTINTLSLYLEKKK